MRVVIDTNAFLVTLKHSSKYRLIFDAFLAEKFELAVSTGILLEYVEVITRKARPDIAANIGELIAKAPNTKKTRIAFRWGLITNDPDDNKFVDCAISARVKFVVTNDKHFEILKSIDFPKVEIISLDDFLEEVKQLE